VNAPLPMISIRAAAAVIICINKLTEGRDSGLCKECWRFHGTTKNKIHNSSMLVKWCSGRLIVEFGTWICEIRGMC
jgi:hypothetical protein